MSLDKELREPEPKCDGLLNAHDEPELISLGDAAFKLVAKLQEKINAKSLCKNTQSMP